MRSSSSSSKSGNAALRGAAAPLSSYEFDFGLGSGASRGGTSLNDQRKKSGASTAPAAPASTPWVHKPISGMPNSSSIKPMAMAGDITGKSWVSPPSSNADSGIVGGVGAGKADMFADLLPMGNSKASAPSISSGASRSTPMNAMKGPATQPTKQADMWGDYLSSSGSSSSKTKPFDVFETTFGNPKPPTSPSMNFPRPFDVFETTFGKPPPTVPASTPAATKIDPLEDMLKKLSKEAKQPATKPTMTTTTTTTATTTELQGLPPPPAGVTATMAMDKGSEFQKQGQFADAIKWLTWAASLATGSDSSPLLAGILGCRIGCFKEVGEYKKAVQDCCQVLEMEGSESATATEVLLQRTFLYESMEKYKLGVADLREVLKRDPFNRVARNTLARLVKMVD